jgi:hypothetical protein
MRATYHRIASLLLLFMISSFSTELSAQEKQLTIGFTNPTGTAVTQATRQTQENISVSDITDWTFAKKANEEMKR